MSRDRNTEGVQDKGKGETVTKRKYPLSEGVDTVGKAQRGTEWSGQGQKETL